MSKKICLITLSNKIYNPIFEITSQNFLKYCDRWNFDFFKGSVDHLNERVRFHWNKGIYIKNLLKFYDWVVYLDADCLIMDFSKNITSFCDEEYIIVCGENYNPPPWWNKSSHLESGVMLFKNHPYTFEFLEKTFSEERIRDEIKSPHHWVEQYSYIRTLEENDHLNKLTKRLNVDIINTMESRIRDGFCRLNDAFIYHCAGGESLSIETRIELLKKNEKLVKL